MTALSARSDHDNDLSTTMVDLKQDDLMAARQDGSIIEQEIFY